MAAGCGVIQCIFCLLRRRITGRIEKVMSADQTFYHQWWKVFSSDPTNCPHLEVLRKQVALVNDSIFLASEDDDETGLSQRARNNEIIGPDSDASVRPPPSVSPLALEEGGVAGWRPQASDGRGWPNWIRRMGLIVWGRSRQCAAAAVGVGVERSCVVRQLVREPQAVLDFADFADVAYLSPWSASGFARATYHPADRLGALVCQRHELPGLRLRACRSIDTLFQQAACLRPILQRKMEAYVGTTPHACRIGGSLQTPLKEPLRAVQKTQRVYGGDCSRLLDICRELLVFDVLEDLVVMLDRLRQDPEIEIVRIKNRLDPNYNASLLSAGYRYTNMYACMHYACIICVYQLLFKPQALIASRRQLGISIMSYV